MSKTGSINADKFGINQYFGARRWYYFMKYGILGHNGLDTGNDVNFRVYAEESGKVIGLRTGSPSAGNYITIRTTRLEPTQGEWRYLHLNKFATGLKIGSTVKRGQVIGLAGMTGDTSGPHLHMDYTPCKPGTSEPLHPRNGYKGKVDPLRRLTKYRS